MKETVCDVCFDVKRESDRIMCLKLEIGDVILNAVSACAPQVGHEMEEKMGLCP